MRQLCLFFVISISLVACTPTINHVEVTPSATTSATTQITCQPSQIQKSENSFPEIQGTMKSQGEMWALLFFDTAYANEDKKIVWRITGAGEEFHAEAQNENGNVILPIWGPDYHGGSSWERPGQEWGTGFNFPEPGCWTITVTRGVTTGEISLDVLSP
jgi:hypothetical protein